MVARDWRKRKKNWGVSANAHGVPFWSDENNPELGSGMGCTVL